MILGQAVAMMNLRISTLRHAPASCGYVATVAGNPRGLRPGLTEFFASFIGGDNCLMNEPLPDVFVVENAPLEVCTGHMTELPCRECQRNNDDMRHTWSSDPREIKLVRLHHISLIEQAIRERGTGRSLG